MPLKIKEKKIQKKGRKINKHIPEINKVRKKKTTQCLDKYHLFLLKR